MESVIKSFLGIFFLILITMIGIGIFVSGVDARDADAFLADCAERIEGASYAAGTIAACQEDAGDAGYELEVEPYAGGAGRAVGGHMVLHYRYRIPLLGIEDERTTEADLH